jgi:hypothetical protein
MYVLGPNDDFVSTNGKFCWMWPMNMSKSGWFESFVSTNGKSLILSSDFADGENKTHTWFETVTTFGDFGECCNFITCSNET